MHAVQYLDWAQDKYLDFDENASTWMGSAVKITLLGWGRFFFEKYIFLMTFIDYYALDDIPCGALEMYFSPCTYLGGQL